MESTGLSKNSVSYGLALSVTSVINALIVIAKEKNVAVMNGMKKLTGHHWSTHTVIALVLFVALAWGFGRANNGRGVDITVTKLIKILVSAVAIASLIIVGFYLFAD